MKREEYFAVQQFLDSEAESDVPLAQLLDGRGLTYAQALERAGRYRSDFFALLRAQGIRQTEPDALLTALVRQIEASPDPAHLRLYCAAVTDMGLLFAPPEDAEQRILHWLEQSQNAEELRQYLAAQPLCRSRLHALRTLRPACTDTDCLEEQAALFRMATQHAFLRKGGNTFLHNIGELVRIVNGCEAYAAIKPFLYTAVLTRKHKLMLEREDYSPNLADILKPTIYRISQDNGKNFDTYQSYLELYDQLRRHFADETDLVFCDYCYTELSNLSDWYYENCQPDADIPMRFYSAVDSRFGFFCRYGTAEEVPYHPVLELALANAYVPGMDAAALCRAAMAEKYAARETVLAYAACFLQERRVEERHAMLLHAAEHFR